MEKLHTDQVDNSIEVESGNVNWLLASKRFILLVLWVTPFVDNTCEDV